MLCVNFSFQMSMEQTAASMFQVTIPFLLQLASMSPVLLKAIALDVTSLCEYPSRGSLTARHLQYDVLACLLIFN